MRCPGPIGRTATLILILASVPSVLHALPIVSPALRGLDRETSPLINRIASDLPGRGTYVDLFLQGNVDEAALSQKGVLIGSRLPNGVITAKAPLGRLHELAGVPGLERISAAYRVHTNNNVSIPATGATPAYWTLSAPNFTGQAGAGVIVGIVDTGIDWSHGDFKNADGTTRILNIWDQNDNVGPNPAGFSYGTVWTSADINAGICREHDTGGHGSHVAGIAAGNGAGTGNGQPAYQFIGMAPKADIICVATTFSTTGVVDGVNYIFQRASALGKSAVVNLSLGTQYGAHDGTETFDTALSSLTEPGKIIVASAGNEGNQSLHAEQLVPPSGGSQTITFNIPTYTPNVGPANDLEIIDAYYQGSANMTVTLTSPGPSPVTVGPIAKGASGGNSASAAGNIYIENGSTPSPSGDTNVYLQIYDSSSTRPPRSGTWTITLTPVSTTASTEIDLWHSDYDLGNAGARPTFTSDVDEAELVGSPGSGTQIVTVGAYTTKASWPSIDGNNYQFQGATAAGTLATFSSPGPLRNNAPKPDITAPGTAIVSTLSSSITVSAPVTNPDGVHFTQQGTSMSSPHVAGAVALMLADAPNLTPADVKTRLAANAVADANTGTVPNSHWGAGKLHLVRDLSAAPETPGVAPRAILMQNRPNPFRPSTTIGWRLPAAGPVSLKIYSLGGELVRTLVDGARPSGYGEAVWDGTTAAGRPAASGVYFYRLQAGNTTLTKRLVLSR